MMDDVDFSLERTTNFLFGPWTTVDSDTLLDEKMGLYVDDVPGGYFWRLKLYGYRVTSDDTGCGNNSIRTYFSWLYEDSARDDGDGPGTEIDTE